MEPEFGKSYYVASKYDGQLFYIEDTDNPVVGYLNHRLDNGHYEIVDHDGFFPQEASFDALSQTWRV